MRKVRTLLFSGGLVVVGCLNLAANFGAFGNLHVMCELAKISVRLVGNEHEHPTQKNELLKNRDLHDRSSPEQPMEELIRVNYGKSASGAAEGTKDLPTGHMTYKRIHGGIGY